jgi:hypothetical protein
MEPREETQKEGGFCELRIRQEMELARPPFGLPVSCARFVQTLNGMMAPEGGTSDRAQSARMALAEWPREVKLLTYVKPPAAWHGGGQGGRVAASSPRRPPTKGGAVKLVTPPCGGRLV